MFLLRIDTILAWRWGHYHSYLQMFKRTEDSVDHECEVNFFQTGGFWEIHWIDKILGFLNLVAFCLWQELVDILKTQTPEGALSILAQH